MSYEILNGNELIIQGGLEAGYSLYTGYPGSPLAEYFNILYKRKNELKELGVRVAIANSEANAAAMVSGAKQAGKDAVVAMKSMGLHVASDALSVGNFANPARPEIDENGNEIYPGVVVVVGDDPWSMSTSTAADSRYLYKHLHIPFLEPSTPTELKDWMGVALQISKRTSLYQGLLLTTFMAEGGGRVKVGKIKELNQDLLDIDPSTFDLSKNVMVPPNSLLADQRMINERFPKVVEVLKEFKLDKTFGELRSKIGFISSGVVFETVKEYLEKKDLLSHYSLYKVGCSYPLVSDFILPFVENLDELIVVEEKRGFLESELRALLQEHDIKCRIHGKEFTLNEKEEGFPAHGGISYEIAEKKLDKLLSHIDKKECKDLREELRGVDGILPKRLPTFCPGCPHRETLSLLKDLRGWLKSQDIDLITHGDVGCYSLSFLPPFKEMHNLSAMGQGGALGSGMDIFTENPSVVLMGDSTFFHSGLTDISNSVQLGHDITYILLDNDNTAMTGHQMTPRSGISVEGKDRPRQSLMGVVKSLGVTEVLEVNPSDRYFYQNHMRSVIKKPGIKVIISNKECALTFGARKRSLERKELKERGSLKEKEFYQINTLACEDCRVCVENTGCPGLTKTFDAYGSKVMIDPQVCVSDSYCTKLKACPSFELVKVSDYHPVKYKDQRIDLAKVQLKVPNVKKSFDSIFEGDPLRIVVTGVGGSGITTISKILSVSASKMGGRDDLDFKFMDQKGLAQRNGNVTSHLSIVNKENSMGAVTPLGSADLLLSTDLLDGVSKLSFLSHDGIAVLDDDFQVPLSILLDDEKEREALTKESLRESLKDKDYVITHSFKRYSEKLLGKSIYASSMILGYCYSMGLLPFSMDDLLESIKGAIKKTEGQNNCDAFILGGELYELGTESFEARYMNKAKASKSFLDLAKESIRSSLFLSLKSDYLINEFNSNLNIALRDLPWVKQSHLIQILHDLYIYDRGACVKEFIAGAKAIESIYDNEHREIAFRAFAKTYFVKDEVFIAHQMISPLLNDMDQKLYGDIGKSFKKVRINRPSFDILGKKVEFNISPKDWMLKTMRHLRFLRLVLGSWHKREKEIAFKIRDFILNDIAKKYDGKKRRYALKLVENIKGYREVRYQKAEQAFKELESL